MQPALQKAAIALHRAVARSRPLCAAEPSTRSTSTSARGQSAARSTSEWHERTTILPRGPRQTTEATAAQGKKKKPTGFFGKFHAWFEHRFDKLRDGYHHRLDSALHHRWLFAIIFLALCLGSLVLVPFLGQDFFPTVDAGPVQAPHPRQDRHAHRGDRQALPTRSRTSIRQDHSRRRTSTAFSTTSACPTAASISPTRTPASSARPTATSRSRSSRATSRRPITSANCASSCRRNFPARSSCSSRPTSSTRS